MNKLGAKILLSNNKGYKWYIAENIYCKGYLFDEDNKLYAGRNLLNYFALATSKSILLDLLKRSNGIFSVVLKKENYIAIACDRLRTFPIFYSYSKEKLIISDNASKVGEEISSTAIDKYIASEFINLGFVSGSNTLIKNVFQVKAGECLVVDKKSINKNFYHHFSTKWKKKLKYEIIKEELHEVLSRSIERMIAVLDGRTAVVPLSGGFDSRLIVSMLYKYGYSNVICFTYGTSKNWEIAISSEVARRLGYKWYFVEYNKNTVGKFTDNESFNDYARFACNFSSNVHLQDYFAVKKLSNHKYIPYNSVFIPGHSGDFIAGSHLTDQLVYDSSLNIYNIASLILKYHYKLNKKIIKNIRFIDLVKEQLYEFCLTLPHDIYENWEIKERQSKFIVNANRIYENFGFCHAIPLWDKEIIDFFSSIPPEWRFNKKIYDEYLTTILFRDYDLLFERDLNPIMSAHQPASGKIFPQNTGQLKSVLEKALPRRLMQVIRSYRMSKFDIGYGQHLLTREFCRKIIPNPLREAYIDVNSANVLYILSMLESSELS